MRAFRLAERAIRAAFVTICITAAPAAVLAQGLPSRLSDTQFWQMMQDFSEPNGYFQSENLLSNETGFQMVIPELLHVVGTGGVYVGVGPEQNFTYIAALQPRMAFIIDIRHQNAMQHLLYKALFELSDDRADFLSRLFSRPRPAGLGANTSVDSLFAAYGRVPPDSLLYYRTLSAVKDRLTKVHGFALSADELQLVEHNFDAFYQAGLQLSYNFGANNGGFGGRGRGMPTYTDLMVQTDNAGVHRSYLATEGNYALLRDLESRNLIVPLTGNFAGPKTVRAVGDYIRQHGAVVSVYYTSNVEQYLFRQTDEWSRFYQNVSTMPLDSSSRFIRSGRAGGGGGGIGGMSSSLTQSMQDLVKGFAEGRMQTYADVLGASH